MNKIIKKLRAPDGFRSGIPPEYRARMESLSPTQSGEVDKVETTFNLLCGMIDRLLSGKSDTGKVHDEQYLADVASRLIIDAAYVHRCLVQAGVMVDPFPFDKYAEKLCPGLKNSGKTIDNRQEI